MREREEEEESEREPKYTDIILNTCSTRLSVDLEVSCWVISLEW